MPNTLQQPSKSNKQHSFSSNKKTLSKYQPSTFHANTNKLTVNNNSANENPAHQTKLYHYLNMHNSSSSKVNSSKNLPRRSQTAPAKYRNPPDVGKRKNLSSRTSLQKDSNLLKSAVTKQNVLEFDKSVLKRRLSVILRELKNEYDKIENKKVDVRRVGSKIKSVTTAPVEEKQATSSWSEKSSLLLKQKIAEMMQRHTAALSTIMNNKIISKKISKDVIVEKSGKLSNKASSKFKMVAKAQPYHFTGVKHTVKDGASKSNSLVKHSVKSNSSNKSNVQMHIKTSDTKLKLPLHVTPIRDELQQLRDKVNDAVKKQKTYTMTGYYYSVRNALNSRGWVEKFGNFFPGNANEVALFKRLQLLSIPDLVLGLKDKDEAHIYKMIIISKLVGNQPVTLYWDLNRETHRNNVDYYKHAMLNFICKTRFNYANKHGLCESAKHAYWYNNPGISYLRVPRSYSIAYNGDNEEFINDFRRTAAMSLMKWIVYTFENKTSKLISESGKVQISFFHFALKECTKFTQILKHEDIDKSIPSASEEEWQNFFDQFYSLVHIGNHFKETNLETEMSLVHKSKTVLKQCKKHWHYVDMDGFMNIWILKPSFGSRGKGIHFCRTMQYLMKVLKDNKNSYIIQKYIERPLLVHNTKFDIRQWFLISTPQPLTIWIWKECYLRFSSQTYNLRKLHESVHLTNNSVQSKYRNGNRDPCLPPHNMWYLKEFKDHLTKLGYPNVYEHIIYPGIKECITAAVLATEDQIIRNPLCFELYGADFMITEDFHPWLIEINSKPALYPSTPVTAKLCPSVLEDEIKVIIDLPRNPKASTGNFELLYKENSTTLPAIDPTTFTVKGQPVTPNYFLTPTQLKDVEKDAAQKAASSDSIDLIKTTDYMKYVGKEMKRTLKQLLSLIEAEKDRRKNTAKNNKQNKETLQAISYCDNLESIKSSMKEMEEIFQRDKLSNIESDRSVCNEIARAEQILSQKTYGSAINITKTSDAVLHSNSVNIKQAISSLDAKGYSKVLNVIGNLKFPVQNKSTTSAKSAKT